MKRITVTLTEDQAKLILKLLDNGILDEDGFQDEYKAKEIAFATRLWGKIANQLN